MKSVFEHSTVNELREMQSMADAWLFSHQSKIGGALHSSELFPNNVIQQEITRKMVSAYQVMFTFYSEVSQELKKRMEITNG